MKYKKLLLVALFVALPTISLAAGSGYKPLTGIPGISDPDADFNTYINALYTLAIALAALLAVIKIIIAGIKWMMTDVVTSKKDAKDDIWGATMGLLLILAAVLFLNIINSDLTAISLFDPDGGAPAIQTVTYASKGIKPSLNYEFRPNTTTEQAFCMQQGGEWLDDGGGYSKDGGVDFAVCGVPKFRGQRFVPVPEIGCSLYNGVYDCDDAIAACENADGKVNAFYSRPFQIYCDY